MANMFDYLDWRGDISFAASPFNRVDNLILAYISYVELDDFFSADSSMTLAETANRFFALHTEESVHAKASFIKNAAFVLQKAGQSVRFGGVRLSHYVSRIDPAAEEQFSALCMRLSDNTVYVSYRGTDDTIVGWKEDFNMSFITPVPSQLTAVSYLSDVAKAFHGPLLLGGHSKGGNLAAYAAVCCSDDIKTRIQAVYDNDGPGFDKSMTQSDAYRAMLPRIDTIVPQSSIIGMLLEHEDDYTVVKSTNVGIMQHDPTSWQVLGTHFETVPELGSGAKLLDASLHAWIGKMDRSQREALVDILFTVLDATNANTVGDLTGNAWQTLSSVASTMTHMSAEDRTQLTRTIGLLLTEGGRIVKEHWGEAKPQAISLAQRTAKEKAPQ
ncbi:MAG: DUF2974 domain-containing protein [Ruthenibacterium sp.]